MGLIGQEILPAQVGAPFAQSAPGRPVSQDALTLAPGANCSFKLFQ